MKKIIILLLCCGVLIGIVGCGGNTAPPPTESPPITVSETIITETPSETIPPVTAVEPTEKEKEPTLAESEEQATEQSVAATDPTTTAKPKEETKNTNKIDRTVAGILDNEVYLGTTVNCKSTVASYKDKRVIERPESEWLKFKNTHDAIIDETTWDIVRKVRAGKRRRTRRGEVNKYSGILHCADCGSKMYFIWGTTIKEDAFGFICSRYHKHMGEELCTPHKIREKALDEIVLEEIRRITYYARTKTNEFIAFINNKSSSENRQELSAKATELRCKEKRNSDLQALFKRLYEDNVIGKVNNEEFRILSEEYREEQKAIKEKIPHFKKKLRN